jgi:transposase
MKKHAVQFKLSVVEHYLGGSEGYKAVAAHHGIAYSLVQRWVAFYRMHGADGLQKKRTSPSYSPEFKLSVLRHMWDNKLSYAETAAKFNIRGQCYIGIWERSFLGSGLKTLMPTAPDRTENMPAPKTKSSPPPMPERADDETRSREDLLKELNHLRMENAYLKKLEALAQADQAAAAARAKRK